MRGGGVRREFVVTLREMGQHSLGGLRLGATAAATALTTGGAGGGAGGCGASGGAQLVSGGGGLEALRPLMQVLDIATTLLTVVCPSSLQWYAPSPSPCRCSARCASRRVAPAASTRPRRAARGTSRTPTASASAPCGEETRGPFGQIRLLRLRLPGGRRSPKSGRGPGLSWAWLCCHCEGSPPPHRAPSAASLIRLLLHGGSCACRPGRGAAVQHPHRRHLDAHALGEHARERQGRRGRGRDRRQEGVERSVRCVWPLPYLVQSVSRMWPWAFVRRPSTPSARVPRHRGGAVKRAATGRRWALCVTLYQVLPVPTMILLDRS